jgi:hypothetical protein
MGIVVPIHARAIEHAVTALHHRGFELPGRATNAVRVKQDLVTAAIRVDSEDQAGALVVAGPNRAVKRSIPRGNQAGARVGADQVGITKRFSCWYTTAPGAVDAKDAPSRPIETLARPRTSGTQAKE